jgi:translocator protein
MTAALARDRWGPVAAALASVLAANLVVALLDLGGDDGADGGPPGWLIGTVWIALFACMGGAYAALVRAPGPTEGTRAALVGLGLLCLAYPFYTGGFDNETVAYAGTAATLAYAAIVTVAASRVSPRAAALLVPLLIWLVVAFFLT